MYKVLMNRHEISNGSYESLSEAKSRIYSLERIFKHSKFEILLNI